MHVAKRDVTFLVGKPQDGISVLVVQKFSDESKCRSSTRWRSLGQIKSTFHYERGGEGLSAQGLDQQHFQKCWRIRAFSSLRQAHEAKVTSAEPVFHVVLLL